MSVRTALVTGASSGIGLDYADYMAGMGWNLVLTARRRDALEKHAEDFRDRHGIDCLVIPADLSDRAAPQAIMDALEGRDIDALINNAGYGLNSTFKNTDWSTIDDYLSVMVGAVTHLPHLLLPGMLSRNYGRIVNIASLAAFAPEPVGSLYTAVKRYMVSMSRGIRLDVMGTGVHCTASCPGFTWTEFHDVLGNRKQMNKLPRFMWQDSRAVVKASWRAVERNRDAHVTGVLNKSIHMLCHMLPPALAHAGMPKAVRERGVKKTQTPR